MKVVLDSSVWVAFFLEDDFFHERALKILEANTSNIFVLPKIIEIEVLNVLRRRGKSLEKIEMVKSKFNQHNFYRPNSREERNIFKYAQLHFHKYNLKTLDLIIFCAVITIKPKLFYSFDNVLIQHHENLQKKEDHQ